MVMVDILERFDIRDVPVLSIQKNSHFKRLGLYPGFVLFMENLLFDVFLEHVSPVLLQETTVFIDLS